MKASLAALSLTSALMFTGCMTSPESNTTREPFVKPGLVMLTADQAARRGINVSPPETPMPKELSALDTSSITVPEGVKVYTLNRSVDPADSELMHEEHLVYRRETAPHWRLNAPAEQKILIGPRVTDGRQDLQPLLNKELTTFLADQRRATEADQKAITALFQAVEALNRQQQTLIRRELPRTPSATAPNDEDKRPMPPAVSGDTTPTS